MPLLMLASCRGVSCYDVTAGATRIKLRPYSCNLSRSVDNHGVQGAFSHTVRLDTWTATLPTDVNGGMRRIFETLSRELYPISIDSD